MSEVPERKRMAHPQEQERLAALVRYNVIDTPPEPVFEDIVKLASEICDCPISLITLLTEDRQWFKAAVGTDVKETPRDIAFCDHAILQKDMLVVPDASKDPRFENNPLVTGEQHLRFYAAAPLETPEGLPLGTLCVLDTKPGTLNDHQKFALKTLAAQIMAQLELRRVVKEQSVAKRLYETVLYNTPDLIYVIGKDKRFHFANQALLSMWGKSEAESLGKTLLELGYEPWHAEMHEREIDEVVATGKPIKGDVPFNGTNGRRIYEYIFSPIFEDNGDVSGIAGATRDVTDRRNVEEALRLSEERRAIALKASDFVGTWDWDIVNDIVIADERFARLYSVDPEKAAKGISLSYFTNSIHPDDLEHTRKLIDIAMGIGGDFSAEYRLIQSDASIRWVHATGKVHLDANGKPVRFPGVAIDITERKKVSDALEESRFAAESANLAKSEFLANMSHEIRTPMNAVIGLSNILGMSQPLTPRQKEYIHTLQMSADSLLALINDLLDISKIEARTVELERVPFSLNQIMQEVISMMGVRVREKNLTFSGSGECIEGRMFIGDPTRLRQIILNLCSNAIKFTERGGVDVQISCSDTDQVNVMKICMAVKDTGIGIAPENLETIFHKFVQADSSISRKYGGSGLGLAITKTLTEIMGGTLSVVSKLGEGSTFTVCIPLEIDTDAVASADKSVAQILEAVNPDNLRPRILLVEDYEPNILVATSFLETFGYSWHVATNGFEAVEKARSGGYLAAIMDVQMHGMNGFEATQLIREHERQDHKPRLPIIGMTAHALAGDEQRCLAAGMDFYITKPFNPHDLQSTLSKIRSKNAN